MQNKAVLMHRFIILAMLKFIVDLTHYNRQVKQRHYFKKSIFG
jgi:hypothetical protein